LAVPSGPPPPGGIEPAGPRLGGPPGLAVVPPSVLPANPTGPGGNVPGINSVPEKSPDPSGPQEPVNETEIRTIFTGKTMYQPVILNQRNE
jgi:cellulose synthase/poly-beta-1,6-N-acetylglucosamine synthase-like glycosyltransferase